MRRVLVTGASGFIGKALVCKLAQKDIDVRAATRNPDTIPALDGVERVAMADLREQADWGPLLDGVSHVVHLAGIAPTGQFTEADYLRINADSFRELAQAASGKVERLVLLSSMAALRGPVADEIVRADDVPAPEDAYGHSKLAAEIALQDADVSWSVLRPPGVYGPGVKGRIATLVTLARTHMPLPLGALQNRRSLVGTDNLVSAIEALLTSKAAEGNAFLVADDNPLSIAEMVTIMRTALGRPPGVVNVPAGAIRRMLRMIGKEEEWERLTGAFIVDTSKLKGIGWSPRVETPEGLKQMMLAP
ncbi:MAG: NAD-dependent epimerase/dehydratase family protein [Alphaproteobacteria bacterium]